MVFRTEPALRQALIYSSLEIHFPSHTSIMLEAVVEALCRCKTSFGNVEQEILMMKPIDGRSEMTIGLIIGQTGVSKMQMELARSDSRKIVFTEHYSV